MSDPLSGELRTLLAELKTGLQDPYGERLVSVLLYGSQARGEATEDSDIDMMVVLRGDFHYTTETERSSYLIAALSLKYDTLISRFFSSEHDFDKRESAFLKNVHREGISV